MKIGFYGHSIASWVNSPNDESFIDRIRKKYSAQIVNLGVPQGSEERIIFDLKKTKEVDAAVIFHSLIRYAFVPRCKRDFNIMAVPSKKAKVLWTEKGNVPTDEEFTKEFFSYANTLDVFENQENFCEAMKTYKEYFYHPDLIVNRFHANVLLIDNYLKNKGIKCYHAIKPDQLLFPSWLKIESGLVDTEILPMSINKPVVGEKFCNNLDLEGNNIVFDKLDIWLQGDSW